MQVLTLTPSNESPLSERLSAGYAVAGQSQSRIPRQSAAGVTVRFRSSDTFGTQINSSVREISAKPFAFLAGLRFCSVVPVVVPERPIFRNQNGLMKNALLAIRNAIVIVSLLRQQRFLLVSVCKRDNPSRSANEGFGRNRP
jgi:hypothetical protein